MYNLFFKSSREILYISILSKSFKSATLVLFFQDLNRENHSASIMYFHIIYIAHTIGLFPVILAGRGEYF